MRTRSNILMLSEPLSITCFDVIDKRAKASAAHVPSTVPNDPYIGFPKGLIVCSASMSKCECV